MSLFEELKRRNVFRVIAAYLVATWVLAQVVDLFLGYVDAPNWIMHVFLLFAGIGFIAAVVVSWAYEMTPEGIKREKDVDRGQSIVRDTGRKLDRIIIAFLAFAVVLLLADRYLRPPSDNASATTQRNVSAETSSAPAPADKSIAVLPFADLSQAGDQEWFADGLAEEILNALVKTPDLQVASRTSTSRYKGSDLDIPQIASELGVAHVLEGSVRSSGDRIRVTAQLIRAQDGFHVWSENYDRTEADMIGIQEDLAVKIAEALETTMDPQALEQMANAGTRSVEAYKAYLRGVARESQVTADQDTQRLLDALDLYRQAVGTDPRFAEAHRRIAQFWQLEMVPSYTFTGLSEASYIERLNNFNVAIDQAIEYAPTATDRAGYEAAKAKVQVSVRAIQLYRQYLDARPNDALAQDGYLTTAGTFSDQAAIADALGRLRKQAADSPERSTIYLSSAYIFENPSEVADFGLKQLRRWPQHQGILYQAHRALMWAGRAEEGAELKQRFERLAGPNLLVTARQACIEGRRNDAEALLTQLQNNRTGAEDSQLWLLLKMLGRDAEASQVWEPYARQGALFSLSTLLTYTIFDPAPFPALVEALERQGVNRPPPVELPYKCPPPEGASIAVLPFVNMSTDAENEFFSDGIAEEILNVLASIPELKVAARTSAFAYKGTNTNISRIANELGVNHILEGSVRKAGNQVRVTAQLIQASDGFHLWSDTYDRELTNIFAIQDEIAGSIAEALKVTMKLEAGLSGNLTGTKSIAAYEHYLRGMQLWHQRTLASLEQAIEAFEAAIAIDPEFAKAHAGLALSWSVISGYSDKYRGVEDENTLAAARQALHLDPDNAEAKIGMAVIYRYNGRHAEAREAFREVLQSSPSFATAHQWYGGLLGEMGDPEAGLEEYRKAWSLDPRSRIIGYNFAWRLWGSQKNEEARQVINEVLEFAPDFPDGVDFAMVLSILEGQCSRAYEYAQRLVTILDKPAGSAELYRDLCQSEDSPRQQDAVNTFLSWDRFGFADPAHPALSYDVDLQVIFIEQGRYDEFWRLFENSEFEFWTLAWLRSIQTENAIRLRCSTRWKEEAARIEMPPPLVPVDCSGVEPVP
ncbi:MAG: tetratricopeptide repeat protein [Xanthomonadales bacterium]|nr:tetratricopeptide repeat protein [Xanthomonadales bacterium]